MIDDTSLRVEGELRQEQADRFVPKNQEGSGIRDIRYI